MGKDPAIKRMGLFSARIGRKRGCERNDRSEIEMSSKKLFFPISLLVTISLLLLPQSSVKAWQYGYSMDPTTSSMIP